MLSCPFCQGELTEHTSQCPSCDLTLASATQILGPIPLLNQGLTDLAGALTEREVKMIQKALRRFHGKFPEAQTHVIIRQFQEECNLSTHLFWLFNTTGLSPQEQRNGRNRDILIGLDPVAGTLGLIVGYGLEPFVKKQDLDALIEKARPHLEGAKLVFALKQVIHDLEDTLLRSLAQVNEALGLANTKTPTY